MLRQKILIVVISLMLAVIINGVPIENSEADDTSKTGNNQESSNDKELNKDANSKNKDSKNGSRIIALNVPPEIKGGTPRPMLFIYSTDKTTTTTAPTTNNTVASAKDSPTVALQVPPVEKDGTPRPMLFLYSSHNTTTSSPTSPTPTTTTVAPAVSSTTKTAAPTVSSTTKTAAPTVSSTTKTAAPTSTTESTSPKGNNTLIMAIKVPPGEEDGTPRPILFIYSADNTTTVTPKITTSSVATEAPTSDSAVTTSTVAPVVSTKSPGTRKVPPVENNGTPHPMLWLSPDTSSPDESIKRPMNFLRGYNCPKRNGFYRYPDKCDVYIICKDYIPLTYICPEGLQFNANARKHELLCDSPSVVKCGDEPDVPQTTVRPAVVLKVPPGEKDGTPRPILFINSLSSTSRPNQDTSAGLPPNVLRGYSCPRRKGLFSYPGKCDVYIMCQDYTPLTYICPDGLQFNPRAQRPDLVCDDPSVVKCGMYEPDREIIRPILRPVHQVISPAPWSNIGRFSCPTPNGYFRFTEQCDEYVECRVYMPLRYICPDGLHFDPDARWTEYPCVEPSLARCRGP